MKCFKAIAVILVNVFVLQFHIANANDTVKRGSVYWSVDRSTPAVTVQEAVRFIGERDYFSFYAIVSMNVVTEFKQHITRCSSEIWGAKIDLYEIISSDFGQRYGTIAVFEKVIQIHSSEKSSWVRCVENMEQEREQIQEVTTTDDGKSAVVTMSTAEGQQIVFFLIHSEGDGWYIDNVKFNSELWR